MIQLSCREKRWLLGCDSGTSTAALPSPLTTATVRVSPGDSSLASLCVGELFTQQIRANGRGEAAVTPPVFVMRRTHWCSGSCLKKRFCSLGAGISHQILAPAPDHLLDACLTGKYAPLKHINSFILHLLLQRAAVSNIV